jgi:hypothetical protein
MLASELRSMASRTSEAKRAAPCSRPRNRRSTPVASPDALVITYATDSFEFEDLLTPKEQQALYWPKVMYVPLDGR